MLKVKGGGFAPPPLRRNMPIDNDQQNVQIARMEEQLKNLNNSHNGLRDELNSFKIEIRKSFSDHFAQHQEQLVVMNQTLEKQSIRTQQYLDNSIASHLRDEGGRLFADKETENIVKGLMKYLVFGSLGIMAFLIGVIVILLQFIQKLPVK